MGMRFNLILVFHPNESSDQNGFLSITIVIKTNPLSPICSESYHHQIPIQLNGQNKIPQLRTLWRFNKYIILIVNRNKFVNLWQNKSGLIQWSLFIFYIKDKKIFFYKVEIVTLFAHLHNFVAILDFH